VVGQQCDVRIDELKGIPPQRTHETRSSKLSVVETSDRRMVLPNPKKTKPRLSCRSDQLDVVQVRRLVAWFYDLRGCLQPIHGVLSSVPLFMQATDQPMVLHWRS